MIGPCRWSGRRCSPVDASCMIECLMPPLRDAYAAAFLEGLEDRPQIAPTDPATTVRVDDTGRAPTVPLRGRVHVGPGCECGVTDWHWHGV